MEVKLAYFTAFIAISLSLKGQFYLETQVGYGLGIGGPVQILEDYETDLTATYRSETVDAAGGMQLAISGGYMFNDAMGAELIFHYQHNLGHTFEETGIRMGNFGQNRSLTTLETEVTFSSLAITPAYRLQLPQYKLKPYLLLGPSVFVHSPIAIREEGLDENMSNGGPDRAQRTLETTTGISFGAYAAAGIQYPLNSHWSLTASLSFRMGYLAPEKTQVTRFTVNGENRLSTLSRSEREAIHFKEIDEENTGGPNRPSLIPYEPISFNSTQLMIGIRFTL